MNEDWSFNHPNDVTNPSSNPMATWDNHHHQHQATNAQNLGAFGDMNMQNNATTSSTSLGFWKGNLLVPSNNLDMCWGPPAASAMLPHSLSQFAPDSGFVERAARLSSFSGGSFEDVINPFGNAHESCSRVYRSGPQVQAQEGFVGNRFKPASGEGIDGGTEDGSQPNLGGETEDGGGDENSNEGFCSMKRRSDKVYLNY